MKKKITDKIFFHSSVLQSFFSLQEVQEWVLEMAPLFLFHWREAF